MTLSMRMRIRRGLRCLNAGTPFVAEDASPLADVQDRLLSAAAARGMDGSARSVDGVANIDITVRVPGVRKEHNAFVHLRGVLQRGSTTSLHGSIIGEPSLGVVVAVLFSVLLSLAAFVMAVAARAVVVHAPNAGPLAFTSVCLSFFCWFGFRWISVYGRADQIQRELLNDVFQGRVRFDDTP